MKSTDNKKARSLENKGFNEVNNLKESQHDQFITKLFKPKQQAFNYW